MLQKGSHLPGGVAEARCNSLDLTNECRKILDCVQAGKPDTSSLAMAFLEMFSNEVVTDFHFPMVVVGPLLLGQFKNDKTPMIM